MIQLLTAKFKNFRLLRNVELEFSRDQEHPLTVIRAENTTGKTTLLTALTWALFGDEALPGRRSSFRLHPLDWDTDNNGTIVEVSVEISFCTLDDETGIETKYTLIRSTVEVPGQHNEFSSQKSDLSVFRQTSVGDDPITNPNAFVNERILPQSLKDVFFIDSDRALAFIEATDERSTKRDRVENAVRSLLGLDILESAELHVNAARREALQAVKQEAQGTTIEGLTTRETAFTVEIDQCELSRKQLDEDRIATEGRKRQADTRMKEALAAGGADRRKIENELTSADNSLYSERIRYRELVTHLRQVVNSASLLYEVSGPILIKPAQLLAELENRKVIPNTLPEVVEDRLARGSCICGQDVRPGTQGYERLRDLLLETSQMSESHEILAHLSASLRRASLDYDNPERRWSAHARDSLRAVTHSTKQQQELEKRVKDLRIRIGQIPDTDISQLEKMVTEEERELTRLTSDIAKLSERIRIKKQELNIIGQQRVDAQKKEVKLLRRLAEETAAKDVLAVIRGTINTLERETLREVSDQMNTIFLNMIAADPTHAGLVHRAELTPEHDIVVHGPSAKLLDPDRDLSGAQRRALTLAFILALVKVSGVRGPNVVDTLLGMTSGPVRRAILEYAALNSTQLVLFLTRAEIAGVEDILDRYAGESYTLTYTGHYPKHLKHDPTTGRFESLICNCNHRSKCQLCERVEAS